MPRMSCLAALIAAVTCAPSTGRAATAVDDCLQADDWPRRVAGCTAVIEDGRWTDIDPATAYHNRGVAHRALGLLERALHDFARAEALDPAYARLYQRLGAEAALSQQRTGQPAVPLCACETPPPPGS